MLLISRLIEKKSEEEFIAKFLFRRRFLEVDFLIYRYLVSALILWLLKWEFECWLSKKDKKADDLLH